MPSTARGNPGEVIGPALPSKSTPTHITLIPPFRPRPRLFVAPKSRSKTHARLQFITLPRRRPPYTSHAACARFRLAKKKSIPAQLDDAPLVPAPAVVELLEARARDLYAQLQQLNSLFDTIQKNSPPYHPHTFRRIQLIFASTDSQFDPAPRTHIPVRTGYPHCRRAARDQLASPPVGPRLLPGQCDYVTRHKPVTRRSLLGSRGVRKLEKRSQC